MQLNPTAASSTPLPNVRIDASEASKSAAAAREQARASELVQAARTFSIQGTVAGVMDGLSTVAMVGAAQSSIPAVLGRMRDIAIAANSGTLSDADRATLQAEYAQLSQQVSSVVGSASAGDGARSSTDKRDDGKARDPYPVETGSASDDSARPATQSVADPASKQTLGDAPVATPPHGAGEHEQRPGATTPRATRSARAVDQFKQHVAAPKGRISLVA